MPDRSDGLNCRVCGRGGGLGETALPCGHAGRVTLPRTNRGFRAVLPESAFLTFLLPFFLLPLLDSRQKKEGAIPCRGFGEALECPARNHERRCARMGAFSTSPALAVKFSRFHLSQNDASSVKSLKLSVAYCSKKPTVYGRESAKYTNGNRDCTPSFLERVYPASISYFKVRAEILGGK